MKTFFLGIDISKDNLDCAVVDKLQHIIHSDIEFANNKTGISKLLQWIKKDFNNDVWIGMEHPGPYGYLLIATLADKYPDFSLINPLEIKPSQGISRGKSHPIEAIRIAQYCAVFTNRLKPFSLPDKAILRLNSLIRTRDHVVSEKTIDINYLKLLTSSNDHYSTKEELNIFKEKIDREEQMIVKVEKLIQEILDNN
ncbi:IS110 family transposase [Membranihabitans marinus]|uniref:IS110 family transposase n=1 Tax=Membranihabitans marinus TaxID=1227546 RepID=UPI001EFFE2E3|nr:transposase [Membranihabitans marinus]